METKSEDDTYLNSPVFQVWLVLVEYASVPWAVRFQYFSSSALVSWKSAQLPWIATLFLVYCISVPTTQSLGCRQNLESRENTDSLDFSLECCCLRLEFCQLWSRLLEGIVHDFCHKFLNRLCSRLNRRRNLWVWCWGHGSSWRTMVNWGHDCDNQLQSYRLLSTYYTILY